jgi:cysteine synthase B
MPRYASIRELAGNTPVVELRSLSPRPGVRLFAKLEGQNPTGSIKDRIVIRILEAARASGALAPGQPIIEASTGNTGVALALWGRLLGHPVEVCVPESVYPEIEQLLAVYGARYFGQFDSDENVRAHEEWTAGEILADMAAVGGVDVFVAGIGTGGTITGVGRRLKEANPACQVLGVEPRLGVHVQGLKSLDDGFIPPILDESVLDGRILVGNRHAFSHARRAMLAEGLFGGISSGAVLHAAMRAASRLSRGNILVIFADGGWKYLGTDLWAADGEPAPNGPDDDPLDDILWW